MKPNDAVLLHDWRDNEPRGRIWQERLMSQLADFVIDAADNAEDIRDWLQSHTQFKPTNILDLDSSDSDQEESKVPAS